MSLKTCKCPYIPCPVRGNCEACMSKNSREEALPHCMEQVAIHYGAKLPLRAPKTEVCQDYEAMSRRCAELVRECLEKKPDSLLCFPAGSTAIGTCAALKEMQEKGAVDFSRARFVALDEWLDLEDESDNCTSFLMKHLYNALGIPREHITLFDIHAQDLEAECKRVDKVIFDHGGIDFMLLGLGMNGHLGLNEPGGSFEDYAKVVELSDTTKNVGQKYFDGPTKLTRGITLGVRHMFETKLVVLQVSGEAKKDIVYEMYHTQPTYDMPGTVLKLMDSLVVLDEAAAQRITDIL